MELLLLAALGVFLSLIGAFDTEQIEPGRRLVYWIAALAGGGVFMIGIETWLERIRVLAIRPWTRAVVLALTMTVPVTVYVATLSTLMFDRPFTAWFLLLLAPNVLIVDVGVVALAWLARPRDRVAAGESGPEAKSDRVPALLREKLEPRLGRSRLVAVEAEDHYLRVHTRDGAALVLLRFSDALNALEGSDGLQVHRSWWVARTAVERVKWSRGRGELELVGGLKAPVSRGHAEAVKAVDWG
jgi:hypothetical protein